MKYLANVLIVFGAVELLLCFPLAVFLLADRTPYEYIGHGIMLFSVVFAAAALFFAGLCLRHELR